MIKLRDSSILIVGSDGRSAPFEPEDLQTRIIKCCLAAGAKDLWIAQDIALSVEFAILSQAKDDPATVRASELDALVTKILDDTGYPQVAERFRHSAAKEDSSVPCRRDAAFDELVAKRAALSGKALDSAAQSAADALASLGIASCSPQLIVELARHFKDSAGESHSLKAPGQLAAPAKAGASPFLVEAKELLAGLSANASALAGEGVIAARPLSRLFPSLGVELRLDAFARELGLAKPATEMALISKLGRLADALDELCARADALCAKAGRPDCSPLPLWLIFADISSFSEAWLDCGLEEGFAGPSSEIASALSSALARAPFKTTLI